MSWPHEPRDLLAMAPRLLSFYADCLRAAGCPETGKEAREYGALLGGLAAQPSRECLQQSAAPEPVARLLRFAGKTRQEVRNPNLTANEAIEVANYIAALQAAPPAPAGVAVPEYIEGGRESVDDALAIVESFGAGIEGVNDEFARQIILAAEVRRLRGLYEQAAQGRSTFRNAYRRVREAILPPLGCPACGITHDAKECPQEAAILAPAQEHATPPAGQGQAALQEVFKRADQLIDVIDDHDQNAPEHRCYVSGAYEDSLDNLRRAVTAAGVAQENNTSEETE